MKFNIEVEIDWIDTNGDIDSVIKNEISERVVHVVTEKIEKEMEQKAIATIEGKVDDVCNNLIESFLKRKITITDKWGEEVISDTSIEEILKKKFDEFWSADVDEHGRSNGRYSTNKPRFEWAIDSQIEKHAKEFAKVLTNDTANKIKANMTESLQKAIGAKLVGELGFDKLLLPTRE